ncbi:MAG: hypothetical protein Q8O00_05465 [Holophaga sp.]|nr:hypothetical protein [Holophaga sp.]
MAGLFNYAGMVIGSIGLFFGFYYLGTRPDTSIRLVTLTTVGIVGILAFARHVIFHKSDAKRLGWETDRPDWMFEVGFANLAFGIIAIIAVLGHHSPKTQAIILLGYAIYLAQAAVLHGYRYFTDPIKSPARLWRSCISTLLYAAMMSYFAVRVLWCSCLSIGGSIGAP